MERFIRQNAIPFLLLLALLIVYLVEPTLIYGETTPASRDGGEGAFADSISASDIDRLFAMSKSELVSRLGTNDTKANTGPEGWLTGISYDNIGLSFFFAEELDSGQPFVSDQEDEVNGASFTLAEALEFPFPNGIQEGLLVIECGPEFKIFGISASTMNYAQIMEQLGAADIIDLSSSFMLRHQPYYALDYQIGNGVYRFASPDPDGNGGSNLTIFNAALGSGEPLPSATGRPVMRFDMDWRWDGAGTRMFIAYISVDLDRPITALRLHMDSDGPGAAGGEDGFFSGQARDGTSEESSTHYGTRAESASASPDLYFEIPTSFTNVTLQAEGEYQSNNDTDIEGQITVYLQYADAPGEWVRVLRGADEQDSQASPATPDNESVSVSLPKSAEESYLQILRNYGHRLQLQFPSWVGDYWENGVAFIDITGDGIPEMFCAMPDGDVFDEMFSGMLMIYTYRDGSVHLLFNELIAYPFEGGDTFIFFSADRKRLYTCEKEYFRCYAILADGSLSLFREFYWGWHPEEDWLGECRQPQDADNDQWVRISKEDYERLCGEVWGDCGVLLFGAVNKVPNAAASLLKIKISYEQALQCLTEGFSNTIGIWFGVAQQPTNTTSEALADTAPDIMASGESFSADDVITQESAAETVADNIPEFVAELVPEITQEPAVVAFGDVRPQLTATASSTYRLKYNSEYTVGADMVIDGNLKTAWNEGASGPGIGEWIELRPVDGGNYQYTGFSIANGFQFHDYHKGDRYPRNNRVKEMAVFLDDVLLGIYVVEDLADGYSTYYFDKPVTGCALRFLINSVYEGKRFPDTCISEIVPF